MPKQSAIEILIFRPYHKIPLIDKDRPDRIPRPIERGVHENLWIKKSFEQYLSIGVYLAPPDFESLKYYFFDAVDDEEPKTYNSLKELKQDLPKGIETIFESSPHLFLMGHGHGGYYGLGNCHGQSEHIYDKKFDSLLIDFKNVLPEQQADVFVTLEACNTDNQSNARANKQCKTFLERVSMHHQTITFSGTGPWNESADYTGFRASGGFPILNVPITSMAGGVWKHGETVIFHHDHYQVAVRKSTFASTETAKALKINTLNFAGEILRESENVEFLERIALDRNILKIQDLLEFDFFQKIKQESTTSLKLHEKEKLILKEEQINYVTQVSQILNRSATILQLTDRELLVLTLGLKDLSVFKGHESLLHKILSNKPLLSLMMVSCGKVLIAGPKNDDIIDRLLHHGANINAMDEKGMTALHYAAQNFFNYTAEPLHLIDKLLALGTSVDIHNRKGQIPYNLAVTHTKDPRVSGCDALLARLDSHKEMTPVILKQYIRHVFQMSAHHAQEECALPTEKREYIKCVEGTLYLPDNVTEQLHALLQLVKDKAELLVAFSSELKVISEDLKKGNRTGEILGADDESIPKRFDAKALERILGPIQQSLDDMSAEIEHSNETDEMKLNVFI